MGMDLLDLASRIEREFGVRTGPEVFITLGKKNEPYDIMVGDLFDFVRSRTSFAGVVDEELDGEDALWIEFQRLVADVLGVDPAEVTRGQGIIHDLGAN